MKLTNGIVEQVTEAELANAAGMVDRFGFFNDPQTGVALAATVKLIRVRHDSEGVEGGGDQYGSRFEVCRFQAEVPPQGISPGRLQPCLTFRSRCRRIRMQFAMSSIASYLQESGAGRAT